MAVSDPAAASPGIRSVPLHSTQHRSYTQISQLICLCSSRVVETEEFETPREDP